MPQPPSLFPAPKPDPHQPCGAILRPSTGARWDRRPSEPGTFKVVGRRADGRYLCVPCDNFGAIGKRATPAPVSDAWQGWMERAVPVMP